MSPLPQLWEWLLLPQQQNNKRRMMISQMQEQLLSKPILSPHLFFSVLLYARETLLVSCPAKNGGKENEKGTK